MKTAILYALVLVALVHGELRMQANRAFGVDRGVDYPYKRLLRPGKIGKGESGKTHLCIPDSTKMNDCNRCFCIEDGSAWACTAMACVPGAIKVANAKDAVRMKTGRSQRVRREPTTPFQCRPNSTFTADCNTCHCSPNGQRVICTKKKCRGNGTKNGNDHDLVSQNAY